MKQDKLAIFVAGGTGGHINAAISVGEYFQKNGFDILFLSGKRELDYKLFSGKKVKHLDSHALVNVNFLRAIKSLAANISTFFKLLAFYLRNRPAFIFGAGGYVCGPALMAGFILGIPVFILEQNSVLGLTNRILSLFSKKTFTHFAKTIGLSDSKDSVVVGNPVRESIQNIAHHHTSKATGQFHLLIFGGSLGATSINKLVANFIQENSPFQLHIKHQTGSHGTANKDSLLGQNVHYEHFRYIEKMEEAYLWADLIICRAGASSLSELRFVRRPCVLIPYPAASHNHQQINAQFFAEEVDFPVFIESVDSLAERGHEKLKTIIEKSRNYNSQDTLEKKRVQVANSTEKIYQEILKNV